MSYVLLDANIVSPQEHDFLAARCVNTGKLISGLIRSLADPATPKR